MSRHSLAWPALLEFDGGADFLELRFHLVGFFLCRTFLHVTWSTVDHILRLFEAQASQLTHDLNNLDLLIANAG